MGYANYSDVIFLFIYFRSSVYWLSRYDWALFREGPAPRSAKAPTHPAAFLSRNTQVHLVELKTDSIHIDIERSYHLLSLSDTKQYFQDVLHPLFYLVGLRVLGASLAAAPYFQKSVLLNSSLEWFQNMCLTVITSAIIM